jgi:hypothetical protein
VGTNPENPMTPFGAIVVLVMVVVQKTKQDGFESRSWRRREKRRKDLQEENRRLYTYCTKLFRQ